VTVIVRRVVAAPVRSASNTWALIVDLLAPSPGGARSELQLVSGVASALIASEAPKDDPIVIWGEGPRIRIYCLFGEDALNADDKDEDLFAKCPTSGDWHMSLPSSEEDLPWVQEELKRIGKCVSARKFGEMVEIADESNRSSQTLQVKKDAFFRS
jgi:hypothetical protein